MYVDLSKLPDKPKEYQITLGALYGGLNTSRLPHEIGSAQLSDSLNVYWRDGMIRSRNGQEAMNACNKNVWHLQDKPITSDVIPLTMYDRPWHDHLFMAFTEAENEVGYIAAYNLSTQEYKSLFTISEGNAQLVGWGKNSRGSFFEFGEKLYYKNRHLFLEISFYLDEVSGTEAIKAEEVSPYTPIIQINTNSDGIGDLYQPENRLSPLKEVWYNGDAGIVYEEIACDGVTKVFHLMGKKREQPQNGDLRDVMQVYIGAALGVEGTDYSVNLADGTITTLAEEAPAIGLKLTVKKRMQRFVYSLPVEDADSVVSVYVKNLSEGGYTKYEETPSDPRHGEFVFSGGKIIFNSDENLAPDYDANVLNSFIKVTYLKENSEAHTAIDECNIVSVFGATGIETNCLVMAGSGKNPNAIFWSGNDSNGANPTYFPMTHYNIIGNVSDPITAFGRQQNMLVVFQSNCISSAEYAYATVDGRLSVSLNIRAINDRIGCDMPQSVQLINNNLVWAHSRYGVMYLKDSTYAYESLVAAISENINEKSKVCDKEGLMHDLNEHREDVCSADDGTRYWLFVGDRAYVWDYTVQSYTSNRQKLSWWLMDNIHSAAWAIDGSKMYSLSRSNIVTEDTEADQSDCWLFTFGEEYQDFGQPMHRCLQMQAQNFGTYDYLKNVDKIIFLVNSKSRSHAKITYMTDYEERDDLVEINTLIHPTRRGFNHPDDIHVRKPKCIHIHTFSVRLETDSPYDLNLIACQILYTYKARTKAGIRI